MILSTRELKWYIVSHQSITYDVEKTSFADRIRKICDHYELTVQEFSRKINVPQPTVQGWINQNREPKLSQIDKIISVFNNISAVWLTTGHGSMISDINYLRQIEEELRAANEKLKLYQKLEQTREEYEALKNKT